MSGVRELGKWKGGSWTPNIYCVDARRKPRMRSDWSIDLEKGLSIKVTRVHQLHETKQQ